MRAAGANAVGHGDVRTVIEEIKRLAPFLILAAAIMLAARKISETVYEFMLTTSTEALADAYATLIETPVGALASVANRAKDELVEIDQLANPVHRSVAFAKWLARYGMSDEPYRVRALTPEEIESIE